MREIERKFLVKQDLFPRSSLPAVIKQGYLSTDPVRVVRIRLETNRAWITIKGERKGITRSEYEYPIPVADAGELLQLSLFPPVEKMRHLIRVGATLWEVDEFTGANQGLLLAEVELESEDQPFDRPEWLGEEVTADHRYYNSWLTQHPFSMWGNKDQYEGN